METKKKISDYELADKDLTIVSGGLKYPCDKTTDNTQGETDQEGIGFPQGKNGHGQVIG